MSADPPEDDRSAGPSQRLPAESESASHAQARVVLAGRQVVHTEGPPSAPSAGMPKGSTASVSKNATDETEVTVTAEEKGREAVPTQRHSRRWRALDPDGEDEEDSDAPQASGAAKHGDPRGKGGMYSSMHHSQQSSCFQCWARSMNQIQTCVLQ
uniref:Uncharacterized protein n=1 Tax=Chromera velia CCMP2878 TaxID=1169474 RepID=A0A0G4FC45_9ALVE|eukprot:Cvel_16294.t1-p1 / transcript=Cvel_16294.t1 / gene=Cvel_16294 / organism=Chromera_velia_CCMP2878 / gene_product=hypothetical protein / transcript_product=hypothetical protein / location=Cvel_scaffold1249:35916-36744(+) / protein_length=154 / sequence_SO=supercontig / SO=protein_coding / is_pseudo=false